MPTFPYRDESGVQVVRALVENVQAEPTFATGCLVVGRAHSYTMQLEYIQRGDGSCRYRVWSDVQGIVHVEERPIALDLADVLAQLRREHPVPAMLPPQPGDGRMALVVLASREGGTWMQASTPRAGQPRGTSALDRVFGLVFP